MSAAKRIDRRGSVPAPRSGDGDWWRMGLIAAAILLVYWNSLSNPFVGDDSAAIVDNQQIRQWAPASVLFPERNSAVAGRPLVNLSFAVNYAFGGLDPRGYHLANIAIHIACALLLFAIVRRTLKSTHLAFVTSLIWALHPLTSEVVDYTVQRTESMMALFYLLTFYCSIRAASPARAGWWQAGAIVSCALGMLCKETIATAPIVVLLYDVIFVSGSIGLALHTRWRLYSGLAATWLIAIRLMLSGPRVDAVGFSTGVDPMTYLLNQTIMISRYLWLVVWPHSLVALYGWPRVLMLSDVIGYAMLIALLLLITAIALIKWPRIGFLGAWFFITLASASSIVPVATEVGAERRMYLPLMALVLLAVIGVTRAWDYVKRRWFAPTPSAESAIGALVLGAVCVSLAVGTFLRNREYASNLSLVRTAVERWPTSLAHQILGDELLAAGAHEEAMPHLREAVKENSKAHESLGRALFAEGKLEDAIRELQAFVQTWHSPVRPVPHWQEPTLSELIAARTLMARGFGALRQWPQVEEQARLILSVYPASINTRALLADSLLFQEKFDEASSSYREYLKSRPNDVGGMVGLGSSLAAAGKSDEALQVFRQSVEINPRNVDAQRHLAGALFDARRADEAAAHARAALALAPDDPPTHDLLGRALAVQGRLDEAAEHFERALQLDPNYVQARDDLGRLATLGFRRK